MFVKQEYHEVRTDYSCYTRQLTDLLQIFASILNDFGEGRVRFTYNDFVEVMAVIHCFEVSLSSFRPRNPSVSADGGNAS